MPIIEVNHLTKEYQLGHISSLKDSALNTLRRMTFQPTQEREQFKALDDVNFHINEGEVVGIIGHNGAGKSTLLKHLANISKPTKGEVIVRGSVAPLIEVGAGVNPELTGRENIFLNGAILGIPKKIIKSKLDEIIEFSELEQFIDTPVKRYSSGMTVKLGFSIATSMDADILIIDEVLAVGDIAFQRKCFDRMEDLIKRQKKTVLLVSHNIRQVTRLSSRAILLSHGKILNDGDAEDVCNQFYAINNKVIQDQAKAKSKKQKKIETNENFELLSISVVNDNGKPIDTIESRAPLKIKARFLLKKEFKKPEIIIGTHTVDFVYLTASSTATFPDRPNFSAGIHEVEYLVDSFPLICGAYAIRFSMFDESRNSLFSGDSLATFTVTESHGIRNQNEWLTLNLPTTWKIDDQIFSAKLFSLA
ncbi:MAG: ATP-binding cassette domain-containing protein [Methyloprofundus sp.]|nr:ATP-binding cassette domain-containing protein [Methyloprofundus sp.]